ncbi:hypothetical protein F5B20DRAFT_562350 [Whalleya microplaca]|nr:hypothetical protein F5B20DRAFT_562350 [Whalleya microplaca]
MTSASFPIALIFLRIMPSSTAHPLTSYQPLKLLFPLTYIGTALVRLPACHPGFVLTDYRDVWLIIQAAGT